MTSKLLCIACVVVAIGGSPEMPAAQARAGLVRGHVYDAEDGKPLRGAVIYMTAMDGLTAMTDERGAYELRNVPPGQYNVTVSLGSYLRLSFGQRQPFDESSRLDVRADRPTDDVDFRLPRGSVLTGHIVDEHGEPMALASVIAARCTFDRGRRRFVAIRPSRVTVTSDDLGGYRLFGLPPGPYCVTARARSSRLSDSDVDAPRYAVTYFPGTPNSADAQRITIHAGETRQGIDFTLARIKAAQISGSVVNSLGRPVAGAYMAIEQLGALFTRTQVPIDASGRFVIPNLPPATYTLVASLGPNETAMKEVALAGQNIDGLQLNVAPRSRVSGIVRIVAGAASPRPTDMLGVVNTEHDLQQLQTWVTLSSDLTFDARVMPGHNQIQLPRLPTGLVLRVVRLRGVDVTDTGFDVPANQDVTGVEVELTSPATTVSGQLTDTGGAPSRVGTVIAFPVDVEKWDLRRYIRTARPDREGRFKIVDLPTGEYYLVSIADLDPELASDAELLDRLRRRAVRFSLNEGDASIINLQVIAEP